MFDAALNCFELHAEVGGNLLTRLAICPVVSCAVTDTVEGTHCVLTLTMDTGVRCGRTCALVNVCNITNMIHNIPLISFVVLWVKPELRE